MSFAQILGQESAQDILRQALRHNRLAHAYLFIGPEGIGKRLTALNLAKALNCKTPSSSGDSCEKCPPCVKINSSNHADVISLEPEGEAIKIDQVRSLQKRLQYRPVEGGSRVCILESADKLNDAASNALLKTLEEPPNETHIILLTSRPHLLLPTILSRCQWVRFKPLSGGQIIQILKEVHSVEEERAHFSASLAGGSAGKALMLSNRMDSQKRLEWLKEFSELPRKSTHELFETCERFSKEEEIQDLLDYWKFWIRDLVIFKVQKRNAGENLKDFFINHDLQEKIAEDADKVSFEQLDSIFGLITEVQKSITLNVNRQLALEALMLGMQKNLAGGWQYPSAAGGRKREK